MADCPAVSKEPSELSSDNVDSAVLLDQSSFHGSIDDGKSDELEKETNSPLDVAEECITSFLHQSIFNTMEDSVPEQSSMLLNPNNASHAATDIEQTKTPSAEETINLLLEANNIVPDSSMSDDRLSITAEDDASDQANAKNIDQKNIDVELEISSAFVSELDSNRQRKFLSVATTDDRLSLTIDDDGRDQAGMKISEANNFDNVLEAPSLPDSKSENRTQNSNETEANREDSNEAKQECVDTKKEKKNKQHKKHSKKKKKKHKKEKKEKKKKEKERKLSEVGAQQDDKPQDVTSMLSNPDYSSSEDSEDQPILKTTTLLSSVIVHPSKQSHDGNIDTPTPKSLGKIDNIDRLIGTTKVEETKPEKKSSRSNSHEVTKTCEDDSRRNNDTKKESKQEKRKISIGESMEDETQKHSSSPDKSEKQSERRKSLTKMDSHEESNKGREDEAKTHSTSVEKGEKEDRRKSVSRSDFHEESKRERDMPTRHRSTSVEKGEKEDRRKSVSRSEFNEESKKDREDEPGRQRSTSVDNREKKDRWKSLSRSDSRDDSKKGKEDKPRRHHSTSVEKEDKDDKGKLSLSCINSHEESKKRREDELRRQLRTSVEKEGRKDRRKSFNWSNSYEGSKKERENETRIEKKEREDRRKSVSRRDSYDSKKWKDEPRRKSTSSTDKEAGRSAKQNKRSHRSRSKSRNLSYSKTSSKETTSTYKEQRSRSDLSSQESSRRRSRSKTPKGSERKKHRKYRSRSKSPTKKDRRKSRSRSPRREDSSTKKQQRGNSRSRSPRRDHKSKQRSRSKSPAKKTIPQSFLRLMSYSSTSLSRSPSPVQEHISRRKSRDKRSPSFSRSLSPSPVKKDISRRKSSDKWSPSRKSGTKSKYSRSRSPKARSTRRRSSDRSPKRKSQKLSIENDGKTVKSGLTTEENHVRKSSRSMSSERSLPSSSEKTSTDKALDHQTTKIKFPSNGEPSLESPSHSVQKTTTGTPSTNQLSSEEKNKEDVSIMRKHSSSPASSSPRKRIRESTEMILSNALDDMSSAEKQLSGDMKLSNALDDVSSAEEQSSEQPTVKDVGLDETLSSSISETASSNNLSQASKDIPALETSQESVEPQQHPETTENSQPDKLVDDDICKTTSSNNESAVAMTTASVTKETICNDNGTATEKSSVSKIQQKTDLAVVTDLVTGDVAGLVTKDTPSTVAKEISSKDTKTEKDQKEQSVPPVMINQSVVTNFDHLPPPPAPPLPMPFPNLFNPIRQFNLPGVPPGAGFLPHLPVAPPLMGNSPHFPREVDTSISSHAQSNMDHLPQHHAEAGNHFVNMTGVPQGLAPTNELEAANFNQQQNRSLLGLPTSASVIPFLGDSEGPKPTNGNDEPAITDVMESADSPVDMELSGSSPEVDIIEKMNKEFWQNEQNTLDEAYEPEMLPDEPFFPVEPVIEQSENTENSTSASKKNKKKKKDKKHSESTDQPKTKVQVLLDKLHRQARVEEEVKLVLKEYYKHREIDKNEYKSILRKAVPQVANSNHTIDPERIRSLVKKYVAKTKGARFLNQ